MVDRASVMRVGGCERGKASPELEDLAELDLGPEERVPPGGGRIVHGAPVEVGVEVRAIFAREAKVVSRHLEAKAVVDERLQRRRRSMASFTGVAAPWRRSRASPFHGVVHGRRRSMANLHGRRRSMATTASAWLVWGNIAKAVIETGAYAFSRIARSRPSVCGSHD